jgi:hypothetical protein
MYRADAGRMGTREDIAGVVLHIVNREVWKICVAAVSEVADALRLVEKRKT